MHHDFIGSDFHEKYYGVLQAFADGVVKRLIINIGPQHGKSEGSSRMLPAFLLGLNPNLRLALVSYSHTLASKFN